MCSVRSPRSFRDAFTADDSRLKSLCIDFLSATIIFLIKSSEAGWSEEGRVITGSSDRYRLEVEGDGEVILGLCFSGLEEGEGNPPFEI
ncbi:hypothetical protein GDO78_016812 [Eleutherodactylus coqui]|uniref:Uncharacterized protein n=1 Tax=Eleutherodactylus coqui TaxID=57060 RepID=A0A8J6BAS5_ELECQ|nr:hypothetical protein GDO78_016812 [Eleutherodactylus coqui]